MPDTINVPLPADRRYSRPFPITLSDVLTEKNLQRNGAPYLFIQNVGASGLVAIAWEPEGVVVDVWLNQGEVLEMGVPRHALSTGTGVGVDLRGFLGVGGSL